LFYKPGKKGKKNNKKNRFFGNEFQNLLCTSDEYGQNQLNEKKKTRALNPDPSEVFVGYFFGTDLVKLLWAMK